jgi:hypothetical protein
MVTYCFDIDGTIFDTPGIDYENSRPINHRIELVNRLYEQGHRIKIFTARGSATGKDWRQLTERQLEEYGVRYHELILGKPSADFYVDDKGANDKHFFLEVDRGEELADDVGDKRPGELRAKDLK